eukprot:2532734-Prymnesium_polylepis.1
MSCHASGSLPAVRFASAGGSSDSVEHRFSRTARVWPLTADHLRGVRDELARKRAQRARQPCGDRRGQRRAQLAQLERAERGGADGAVCGVESGHLRANTTRALGGWRGAAQCGAQAERLSG